MKIALCGPVSLHLVRDLVDTSQDEMPIGYGYPLAAYLARRLHERGHEVALVTSSATTTSTQIWRGERFTIYHTPRRRFFRFTLDAYAHERRLMRKALEDFSPDIIHAQWTYEFAHVAIDSGFPALVTARDAPWTIFRHLRTPYRLYRALYAHYVIPRIECMSAISPYVGEQICKEYRYRGSIEWVPNGLSRELFNKNPRDIREGQPITFISVSGWDPRKNVKTLLRAFHRARQQLPEAKLILIGRGLESEGPGRAWAQALQLAEGVAFRGALSHADILRSLRDEADIFVHSTLEESFCMTVLEAMAQRLPTVVLPDSGAVPWLLGEGAAGKIADSQTPESLAEAMCLLARDSPLREELGEAGYARAISEFDLESVADCYLAAYEKTIRYYAAKN